MVRLDEDGFASFFVFLGALPLSISGEIVCPRHNPFPPRRDLRTDLGRHHVKSHRSLGAPSRVARRLEAQTYHTGYHSHSERLCLPTRWSFRTVIRRAASLGIRKQVDLATSQTRPPLLFSRRTTLIGGIWAA